MENDSNCTCKEGKRKGKGRLLAIALPHESALQSQKWQPSGMS